MSEDTAIWVRFVADGVARFGRVENDHVLPIDGTPFGEHSVAGSPIALAGVRLLPPTLPSTFFCVGLNYRSHIQHAIERGDKAAKLPERPEVGYRANNALVADGEAIIRPADLEGPLEAEGELVAVIGRRARRCTAEEAREIIFGWTIGNDVSARRWQDVDRTFWRSKNSDTFKPMGPWIVTGVDPLASTTSVRVGDRTVCSFPTGDMVFDPFEFLAEITKYITVFPGDVLWMGADGVAAIEPGDVVEIEIDGIGTLRNPVLADDGSATSQTR